MTENTSDEFVYDLASEDYWTPATCAHWPPEKQPRLYYRIPTASEAQQFSIAQSMLREGNGLASDDTAGFWALPEAIEMYLDAAERYVTRIENVYESGDLLEWRAAILEEHGLTKRGLLIRLGASGQQRFFALFGLVGTIFTGLRVGTKKNSPPTSSSGSDSRSTDAVVKSAPAATTEATS